MHNLKPWAAISSFSTLVGTMSHASSGVPGGIRCSRSSGGVIGAGTDGVSGGGPGAVRGLAGVVQGGVRGSLLGATFSGKPIGKIHAELSNTGSRTGDPQQYLRSSMYVRQCSQQRIADKKLPEIIFIPERLDFAGDMGHRDSGGESGCQTRWGYRDTHWSRLRMVAAMAAAMVGAQT